MSEKFVNHWGKWVNEDTPSTGVLNGNQVKWEFLDYDYICLECEEWINYHDENADDNDICPNCEEYDTYCLDDINCDGGHTHLYGDWIKDENGLYGPNKNGEYAFIYNQNENTIQVVWSKFTTRGSLCSPCYPGQVDVGSKGDFLSYTLPSDCLWTDEN